MPTLPNSGHEAFARACAAGASPRDAFVDAGYSPRSHRASDIAKRPEVVARIAELEHEAAARPTLTGLTEGLTRVATLAEKQGTATALGVARSALMDLARLHGIGRLSGKAGGDPTPQEAPPLESPPEPPLTEAEWLELYAPKDR